jgi:hypothetical protein
MDKKDSQDKENKDDSRGFESLDDLANYLNEKMPSIAPGTAKEIAELITRRTAKKKLEKPDKKKVAPSAKFKRIYKNAEMEKQIHQILKPGKLKKIENNFINEDFANGEMEVWKAGSVEYLVRVEDMIKLGGKEPKVFVSQMKNIALLMGLTQEQQYHNTAKEAVCRFQLSYYAERRGYTKEEHGKILEELKRDLLSGALTSFRVDEKVIRQGREYIKHSISSFYSLYEPMNSGDTWEVEFKDSWKNYIEETLNKEGQFFIEDRNAIEDRYTTRNPYLYLFYRQLIKRKKTHNLLTQPIKVKNLLEDMKIPEKILVRPKECYDLLKECLIYFSENYQPLPEIESFKIYNDFNKTKAIKELLHVSEAFKQYPYKEFKEDLAAIGIKDIREAFISFKRYPEEPEKTATSKKEEESDLSKRTLKWFAGWEITIPKEDQESMIRMYIRKLGAQRYEEIFNREANRTGANAVEFLTKTLKSELGKI